MHEGGGSANFRCQKLNLHGLEDPAMLQEARAMWLGELAVQKIKLARVNRPSKVERGQSEVARRTCDAGKKVISHGLADPAGLKDARARWLGELKVQESPAKLQESRARWLGELVMQESKLAWISSPARLQEARARWLSELAVQENNLARVNRPDKVARGTSEVARRTCGAGK
ncbi:hypothetical protein CRG98_032331 [Punica granatum]|uniref:Uncharacterized protein n=1 Tax=Punica granatum TaxID=22663 RepID=A0A2I0ITE8_PUNGR|nr:hypothetical protein CRG98_032331 [Punica granatum]